MVAEARVGPVSQPPEDQTPDQTPDQQATPAEPPTPAEEATPVEEAPPSEEATPSDEPAPRRRRLLVAGIVAAVLVLVAAGGALVLLLGDDDDKSDSDREVLATVEDVEFTFDEVSGLADDYCGAIKAVVAGQEQPEETEETADSKTPLVLMRTEFLSALVRAESAEQVAAEREVEVPEDQVDSDMESLETELEDVPEKYREAVRRVIRAQSYAFAATTALGAEEDAAEEEQADAGLKVVGAWMGDHVTVSDESHLIPNDDGVLESDPELPQDGADLPADEVCDTAA